MKHTEEDIVNEIEKQTSLSFSEQDKKTITLILSLMIRDNLRTLEDDILLPIREAISASKLKAYKHYK